MSSNMSHESNHTVRAKAPLPTLRTTITDAFVAMKLVGNDDDEDSCPIEEVMMISLNYEQARNTIDTVCHVGPQHKILHKYVIKIAFGEPIEEGLLNAGEILYDSELEKAKDTAKGNTNIPQRATNYTEHMCEAVPRMEMVHGVDRKTATLMAASEWTRYGE